MSPPTVSPLPDLDALPADALIDADAVAAVLACCVRHVHRMAAAGRLPAPLRIGQLVRWRAGTLRAWLRRTAEGQEATHAR
jgi:predicted DNA-binding transcriptional regulator AlpA